MHRLEAYRPLLKINRVYSYDAFNISCHIDAFNISYVFQIEFGALIIYMNRTVPAECLLEETN